MDGQYQHKRTKSCELGPLQVTCWSCDGFAQRKLTSLAATLDSEKCAAHVVALIENSEHVPSYAMEGYKIELE